MLFLTLSGETDGGVLLDLEGSERLTTAPCLPAPSAFSISFSPFHQALVVSQKSNAIFFFSPKAQQPIYRSFVTEPIGSTLISRCGMFLFAGALSTGHLYIWNLLTGELTRFFPAHLSQIHAMALSFDGTILATVSEDSTCQLWRLKTLLNFSSTPSSHLTLSAHTLPVRHCTFFYQSLYLATVSDDRTCRIFSATNGRLLRTIITNALLRVVAISRDDNELIVGGSNGELYQVSLTSPSSVPVAAETSHDGHNDSIVFVTPHPNNPTGWIIGSKDGAVIWWEITMKADKLPHWQCRGVVWRRGNITILSGITFSHSFAQGTRNEKRSLLGNSNTGVRTIKGLQKYPSDFGEGKEYLIPIWKVTNKEKPVREVKKKTPSSHTPKLSTEASKMNSTELNGKEVESTNLQLRQKRERELVEALEMETTKCDELLAMREELQRQLDQLQSMGNSHESLSTNN